MTECSTTIGVDVGDRSCQVYELDNASGEELAVARVGTTPGQLGHFFRRARARVVLEVGGQTGWISRLLTELGHEVLIADPRKARKLMGDETKDDRLDAELLARFGRADPKLLKPVKLRGEKTQCDLATLRSRDALVGSRTKLINHVRAMVKGVGQRLRSCSADSFHKLEAALPEVLQDALVPVMATIGQLTMQIRTVERTIERQCQEDYPQAEFLRSQIKGVGPITALAFVLTIEDPMRFANSRKVGPYLGLCRRRWQSGEDDPELHITKAGDAFVRRLLIQCAHYILGPFGADSDLRRWGLAYAERGGRAAKKRAAVAVARKLAVLMHRLWVTGEIYEPLRNSNQRELAA